MYMKGILIHPSILFGSTIILIGRKSFKECTAISDLVLPYNFRFRDLPFAISNVFSAKRICGCPSFAAEQFWIIFQSENFNKNIFGTYQMSFPKFPRTLLVELVSDLRSALMEVNVLTVNFCQTSMGS